MPSEKIGGKLTPSVGSLHGVGSLREQSLHGQVSTSSLGGRTKWGQIIGYIYNQQDLIELFNNINVDDLRQDENSFFILDCGSSIRNTEE